LVDGCGAVRGPVPVEGHWLAGVGSDSPVSRCGAVRGPAPVEGVGWPELCRGWRRRLKDVEPAGSCSVEVGHRPLRVPPPSLQLRRRHFVPAPRRRGRRIRFGRSRPSSGGGAGQEVLLVLSRVDVPRRPRPGSTRTGLDGPPVHGLAPSLHVSPYVPGRSRVRFRRPEPAVDRVQVTAWRADLPIQLRSIVASAVIASLGHPNRWPNTHCTSRAHTMVSPSGFVPRGHVCSSHGNRIALLRFDSLDRPPFCRGQCSRLGG